MPLISLFMYRYGRVIHKRFERVQARFSDITARAQESDRKIGEETGADAYVTKPFEPQTLLAKIKELIK